MDQPKKRGPALTPSPALDTAVVAAEHRKRHVHMAPKERRPHLSRAKLRQARSALAILSDVDRIDRRTAPARFLQATEAGYVDALGGLGSVSPQQSALCRVAARTQLLLEQVDAYLLRLGSPVNHGKRALFTVVRERAVLADSLLRQLQALGLQRVARPVTTLAELRRQIESEAAPAPPVPAKGTTIPSPRARAAGAAEDAEDAGT